jgi:hypothetical protein
MRIYNDEKILYKTKDLPETLSGLFTDQKQFQQKINAAKQLTQLKVDYRSLNHLKVGFLGFLN